MKKSTSQLLSALLALCMLLALLPGMALAAEPYTFNNGNVIVTNVIEEKLIDGSIESSTEGMSYYVLNELTCVGPVSITPIDAGDGGEYYVAVGKILGGKDTAWTVEDYLPESDSEKLTDPGDYYVFVGVRYGDGGGFTGYLVTVQEAEDTPDNPDTPNPSAPTIPATGTAYPSTQTVDIDGTKVEFQMYALRDDNGGETNYIKVRDLALAMSTTKAPFDVLWDGVINLVPGDVYEATGVENSTPFSGKRTYKLPSDPTNINGEASDLQAFVLTDDIGGQYTYYQLRDLGLKLGFNVSWSQDRGVFIESDKEYSELN